MKKFLSILATSCLLISCGFAFLACGNSISGTYRASVLGSDIEYEFGSFGKVIIRIDYSNVEETVIEGEYTLSEDGNKITFTLKSSAENEDEVQEYSGTFDFKQGEDEDGNKYVKIGIVTYTEVKK